MQVLVEEVKKIAKAAGRIIMDVYADEDSFDVEIKEDDSPLTRADKLANEVIVNGLQQLDVDYPIISEETKLVDYTTRKGYERLWMVDPLDGTKEFIKRNGEFTVNIALIESNRPVLGVIHVPVTDDIYWAQLGNGAFSDKNGIITQLHAEHYTMKDAGLRVVCSRSHLSEVTQQYIDQFIEPSTISRGSSLKFLTIAEGGAELYPRLAPTMEWDTAAADIILTEAGGSLVQFGTEEPMYYNKEDLLNPHFLASAAKAI